MKKTIFIAMFLISTVSTFGQQILWSTNENKEEVKCVPFDDVTKEVLEFYALYQYYYDHSGYTKDSFFEKHKNLSKFSKVENGTVVAFKKPSDDGSIICVLLIDKDNVDMVAFSNVIWSGFQTTHLGSVEFQRNRFEKWFKTLLN